MTVERFWRSMKKIKIVGSDKRCMFSRHLWDWGGGWGRVGSMHRHLGRVLCCCCCVRVPCRFFE